MFSNKWKSVKPLLYVVDRRKIDSNTHTHKKKNLATNVTLELKMIEKRITIKSDEKWNYNTTNDEKDS